MKFMRFAHRLAEALKASGDPLTLESRQVGGKHPHQQHFWVHATERQRHLDAAAHHEGEREKFAASAETGLRGKRDDHASLAQAHGGLAQLHARIASAHGERDGNLVDALLPDLTAASRYVDWLHKATSRPPFLQGSGEAPPSSPVAQPKTGRAAQDDDYRRSELRDHAAHIQAGREALGQGRRDVYDAHRAVAGVHAARAAAYARGDREAADNHRKALSQAREGLDKARAPVPPESLKNHDGKHLEHRQVGGAHPHMQRFWVSTAPTADKAGKEMRDHAVLHAEAAAEHRRLADHHGHGIKIEAKGGKWSGGDDDVHQQKLNLEATHPHLDFGRAHAHDKLATLHEAAANLATGIDFRLKHGHDARAQGRQLEMIRDHIDDWSYYARPRHEIDADEHDRQAAESAGDQGRYRDYDDGAPGRWGP